MSDLTMPLKSIRAWSVSSDLKATCLFCLVGLAISAAAALFIQPEQLAWVLAHVE